MRNQLAVVAVAGFGIAGLARASWGPGAVAPRLESGRAWYAAFLAAECACLVFGTFHRTSRLLAEDRRNGLFEANRLTPLQASQIASGYWFGGVLREACAAGILAAAGLALALPAGLPLSLWLETQLFAVIATFQAALFAVAAGLCAGRQGLAWLWMAVPLFPGIFSQQPAWTLSNTVAPINAMLAAFHNQANGGDWGDGPQFMGTALPPALFAAAVQCAVSALLWRAVVRKIKHPESSPLAPREACAGFAALAGLEWILSRSAATQPAGMLPSTRALNFAFLVFAGLLLIAAARCDPRRLRVRLLQEHVPAPWRLLARSGVPVALLLSAFLAAWLAGEIWISRRTPPDAAACLAVVLNGFGLFAGFAVLLDLAAMQFHGRERRVILAGAAAACLLPPALALMISAPSLAGWSFLAPGARALLQPAAAATALEILAPAAIQAILVFALLLRWLGAWPQFLLQPQN
ncbi:MAG: hypothetical protein U1F98_04975 [Verrucomicrobiota bacterium]